VGPYLVGREKVREFAQSVSTTNAIHIDVDAARAAGHPDVVAPPTFVAVVVEPAVGQLLGSLDTGLDPARWSTGRRARGITGTSWPASSSPPA
jgi:acyl dehydratase